MPDSTTLDEVLLQRAEVEQCLQFNLNAALQKRSFADEFIPNSPEFTLDHAGTRYVGQRAERLRDGAVRVYYCLEGKWDNVHFLDRPLPGGPPPPDRQWPFAPDAWRPTIWAITSIFESGQPQGRVGAFQNEDAGIISYGKHQATLQSGSLNKVLEEYFHRVHGATKAALQQEYAERIKLRDESLRHDPRLKALLLQAALEPEMSQAQDLVFDRGYYQPAVQKATQYQIRTPLGLACMYDTAIQGGLDKVLKATAARLGSAVEAVGVGEKRWLAVFLDERETFLHRVADKYEAQGNHTNATWLRNSTFRVEELRKLLSADNLGLEGELTVRQIPFPGIVHH